MKTIKTKNGKRQAIIYVRVSSDEQVKGTSLDDQEKRCRLYCTDQGLEVLEVFREEGASAKSADRKILLEAIEFCRKNKGSISAFVVWKVDRFARNTEDHFAVRKILLDYGTTLMSVTEPIGNNPVEKLLETVLAATSEFDNSIRRQRCTNGMLARVLQGIWPWKPPVGYICAKNKKQGKKKTEPDKIHEKVFPLIQRMLKGYAKQIYTPADIAQELEKADFKKLTGMKPRYQLVDMLLHEHLRFYAGWLRNPWPSEDGRDKYIRGQHTPMIDEETMNDILFIQSGGKIRTRHDRNNPEFPLRRLLVCISCGKALTGSTSKGNGGLYPSYHCYNKECSMKHKSISKDKVEPAFIALLEKVTPTEEFLKYFSEVVLTRWDSKVSELQADAKVHEDALRGLEIRRRSIFDMRELGVYTPEQFNERLGEVEIQITTANISLNETRIDQYDIEAGMSYCKQAIRDVSRQWLDLPPILRARFQKVIFPAGIAYDRLKGFGTIKLGRIYTLNQLDLSKNYGLVDPSGFEPLTSSLQMRRSTN